ncbi:MAG TPA: hypothetical protein VF471_07695 [Pseudoxanthomonas sp.]
MNETQKIEQVRAFIKRYANIGLFSTGAKLVDFSDELYNVTGSTDDPTEVPGHRGVTWRNLLVRLADLDEANCYVTNEIPKGESSHPNFLVGGHMTPNSTGIVPTGEISYLMPLCKWHNSTGRNGIAFEHTETRMLELKGFMEGDSALTFALRLPSEEQYSLLYFDRSHGGWEYRNLSDKSMSWLDGQPLSAMAGVSEPVREYVLFERRGDLYYVMDTNL